MNNLRGKRYIGLLRCSSPGQIDTSIGDQRRVLEAYARDEGLVCADYLPLEGVSGSLPGNRTDIQDLIRRKQQKDDFDVLLVQDTSRFTRAGVQHAHHLESELNAAGIQVAFVITAISSGPEGDLMKSVYAFSDQQHAKAISFSSARGSMSSILDARSPYCRRPPYGIDRLYVAPDGKRLHIIRNLPDGTQVRLDPDTGHVTGTFGVNEKSGVPNHYIKQKQEQIVLVRGDERCLGVVRRIYRRACVDNLGWFRIAKELNDDGIPSPTGKKWNTQAVAMILRNPIYLGRGIANRYTAAIYNMRAPNAPVPAKVEKQELYNRKRPARRTRPESDWHVQDYPQFADLLEPEVREIAAARQEEFLRRQSTGHRPKPNRDGHRDSDFILKDLLRSKQGDCPMTGHRSGKRSQIRYYRVREAYTAPDSNAVMRTLIRAEPLEQTVLEVVNTALLSMPDLHEQIELQIRAALKSAGRDHEQRDALLAERETIRRKLKAIVARLNPDMIQLIEDEIAAMEAQLHSVNERLARCEATILMDDQSVRRLIDESVAAIRDLGRTLAHSPPATLRQYLQLLVKKMVVDLETRDVEMEVGLPESLDALQLRVCLLEGPACRTSKQTHPDTRTVIGTYRLRWDQRSGMYSLCSPPTPTQPAAA